MKPTIGRIVLYTLTDADAWSIKAPQGRTSPNVIAGTVCPLLITSVLMVDGHPKTDFVYIVSGHLFLDNGATHWVERRETGSEHGTWRWPLIEPPCGDRMSPPSLPLDHTM